MLEYIPIKSSGEKVILLKNFDTQSGLWIIPHSQVKYDLQNFYVGSQKNLIGDPFKTISEFWEEMLLRYHPKVSMISEDAITIFIKSELHTRREKWCHLPGAASIVFKLLSNLLPVLSHIEGPELLSQLTQTNTNIRKKWGKRLLEAMKIWKKIKGQFVAPLWIPSLLSHFSNPFDQLPYKTIVVDMSCDLLPVEMQIFEQLAQKNHVIIIGPDPAWLQKYPHEFSAYHLSHKSAMSTLDSHDHIFFDKLKNTSNRRFVSTLAEVKDAVNAVRRWLDEGIEPTKIVISGPSIKTYLPALQEHLDSEGIPYNQPFIIAVRDLPDIIRWVSKMQVQLKPQAQAHALELAIFTGSNQNGCENFISYKEFHRLYSRILDPEDYKRSQTIYKQLVKKKAISKDTELDAFSFLTYAQGLARGFENLSAKSVEGLTLVLKSFIQNTKGFPPLKASYWLDILESIISKTHISSQVLSFQGVHLCDLIFADKLFAQKIYMMGLSEQSLKGQRSSLLNNVDISSINNQLGFFLEPVEKSPLEFCADWMLSHPTMDKVISFPETNFIGDPLTPSILWLRGQQNTDIVATTVLSGNQAGKHYCSHPIDLFESTRYESQTREGVIKANDKNRKEFDLRAMTLKFKKEIEGSAQAGLNFPYNPSHLSVSSLERYHKCPFIFYAEDVLNLRSYRALDMDMDPLDQGTLTHALLSQLTEEPFQPHWTDEQLDKLVEETLVKEKISLGEPQFKKNFKSTQIKKLQEFLQFEKEWREDFQQTKTILREEEVFGYLCPHTGQISPKEKEGFILIKGRLDRLDQVGDHVFTVIDYKSSLSGKTNHKTWLEKGEFQLGLYALMVKEGCLKDKTGDMINIASAVYFGIKEMKRDKGFLLKEYDGLVHKINNRSRHKIDKDQQEQFFQDLQKQISQIVSSILQGHFQPSPKDKGLCQTCDWRNICQAPHLM